MTVFTTNHNAEPHNLFDGIVDFFAGLAVGYRTYLAYTRLDAMTDNQLAAMGIARTDVPRVAAAEMFGTR